MNQFVEFEGKNIDQALARASDELGTPVERLEYDVVSYGSSGIFGLVGAKKAKIRVRSKKLMGIANETRQQARDLVKDAFQLEEDCEQEAPESEALDSGEKSNKKEADEKEPGTPKVSDADMEKVIATGREALHLQNRRRQQRHAHWKTRSNPGSHSIPG
jgi:spoIIIJ-associated protein